MPANPFAAYGTSSAIGAASFATSRVNVTVSAALLVAARPGLSSVGRVAVTLYNRGTVTVYVGPDSNVASTGTGADVGIDIPAGASLTLNTTAAIYGKTDSGSSTIAAVETY